MIRWIHRHKYWAGFNGTSKEQFARVQCKDNHVVATVFTDVRFWYNAPTISAAQRWCEAALHHEFHIKPVNAWFVYKDGKTEQRVVEPYPIQVLYRVPSFIDFENFSEYMQLEKVELTGKRWTERIHDPWRGFYGSVNIIVYVEDGANDKWVRSVAERELHAQKVALGYG